MTLCARVRSAIRERERRPRTISKGTHSVLKAKEDPNTSRIKSRVLSYFASLSLPNHSPSLACLLLTLPMRNPQSILASSTVGQW